MMFSAVGEPSSLQRMRCDFCGYETFYHLHFITDEEHAATAEASRWVTVFIVWRNGSPTAVELIGLRHVVASWRDKGLAEVRGMLGDSDRHCLGEIELWKAKEMREKALKFGVAIEWVDGQQEEVDK